MISINAFIIILNIEIIVVNVYNSHVFKGLNTS